MRPPNPVILSGALRARRSSAESKDPCVLLPTPLQERRLSESGRQSTGKQNPAMAKRECSYTQADVQTTDANLGHPACQGTEHTRPKETYEFFEESIWR